MSEPTITSAPLANPETFSKEQVAYLEANWQRNLLEVTREVYSDPSLTTRSPQYKAVKTYVATLGKVAAKEGTAPAAGGKKFELPDEVKATIREIYLELSGPLEIARVAFKNPALQPSSREVRTVALYCREIDPMYRREEDSVEELEYSPPKSIIVLMGKVNKYALVHGPDGKKLLDPATATPHQLKNLQALMTYMWSPLFKVTADKYIKRIDRELFESTFIMNCWDKPDLLAEELGQYIDLAAITVDYNMIDRTVKKLDERLQFLIHEAGTEKLALNMSEVELLTSVREKANAAMKQKASLLKSLTVDRAKRVASQRAANGSMHDLVTAWRNKQDRQRIIQTVEREKRVALKQEVERLSTIDAIKGELFGVSKDDITR